MTKVNVVLKEDGGFSCLANVPFPVTVVADLHVDSKGREYITVPSTQLAGLGGNDRVIHRVCNSGGHTGLIFNNDEYDHVEVQHDDRA